MRSELQQVARRFRAALGLEPGPAPSEGAPATPPPRDEPPAPEPATPPPPAAPSPRPSNTPSTPEVHQPVEIEWRIAKKVRCDLLAYAGLHTGGQLQLVRVFPTGDHNGDIDGAEFQSLMIAGPIGTRVVLASHAGDDWQDHPWRCIRLVKGQTFTARNGKPAVRVPDLDQLDDPDAWRANPDVQQSYPIAASLDDGEGWTYGRPGTLKNNVAMILVDKV